jgi:hypothetical protein
VDANHQEEAAMRRVFVLTVGIALVMAAVASAAVSGLYSGTTSQGLKITVKVSNSKVVKVAYTAKYGACGEFTGSDKVAIGIRRGAFSATVHPNSETVDKLAGSFKGEKVTGTISSTVTTGGIQTKTCKSGRVAFTARH